VASSGATRLQNYNIKQNIIYFCTTCLPFKTSQEIIEDSRRGEMDDFSIHFKDIIVPIAPSILYERQSLVATTPPPGTLKKKKSTARLRAELFINIPAFIERGLATSSVRRTPIATTGPSATLSASTTAIFRRK
jgi:hypothetical protein